jgi:spore coat polysaccharide biosynthesis protein SpsF (cytidylyltransferase family)
VAYQPLTIAEYHSRLKAQGLPESIIQHFCAIATDYQNGIFSGADEVITRVTGKAPMTVQQFVQLHRGEFRVPAAA